MYNPTELLKKINGHKLCKQKIDLITKTIEEWVNKEAHNSCWYYPDIFNKIVKILNIPIVTPQNLPPRCEFENGCKKYIEEIYKETETFTITVKGNKEDIKRIMQSLKEIEGITSCAPSISPVDNYRHSL